MRCPECNSNVYSHHQKINKSGTEIRRYYDCSKCNCLFETSEQIIDIDEYAEVTMNLNELREAMASDATKENASLKEENARLRQMVRDLERNYTDDMNSLKEECQTLSNRCFALTHGAMCYFCGLKRYKCSHALTDMEKIEHVLTLYTRKEMDGGSSKC